MDDLISRQDAINAFAKAMPSLTTPDGCGQFDHDIYIVQETFVDNMQIIANLQSAEKIGKWKKIDYADEVNGYVIPNYECSNCQNWVEDMTDYCPNCGAKMEG